MAMENEVVQKLASSGLDDFSLPKADTESRGTNPTIVEAACNDLTSESGKISNFVTDLETTKNQLLSSWEGASAETFRSKFPELISCFEQIPTCINSISDWATEVSKGYQQIDQALALE